MNVIIHGYNLTGLTWWPLRTGEKINLRFLGLDQTALRPSVVKIIHISYKQCTCRRT